MFRRPSALVVMIAGVVLTWGAAAARSSQGASADAVRVLAAEATVRVTADPNSLTLATVPAGTVLEVKGKEGAWYSVWLPGESGLRRLGYVAASDVERLLAIAVGLVVGACCGWAMYATHKIVVTKLQCRGVCSPDLLLGPELRCGIGLDRSTPPDVADFDNCIPNWVYVANDRAAQRVQYSSQTEQYEGEVRRAWDYVSVGRDRNAACAAKRQNGHTQNRRLVRQTVSRCQRDSDRSSIPRVGQDGVRPN